MIEIDNTLISLDIIEKNFVCDYAKCKGVCCIEGDSGAPVNEEEIAILQKDLQNILAYVPKKNKKVLKKEGVFYIDQEGEKVTTLVENAECAFVTHNNGVLTCAIELAWKDGKTTLQKPISCHLYPIRSKKYRDFEALNYDTWHICKDAVCKGNTENIKIYQFLKESLIRKYGRNWYTQLEMIATEWQKQIK
ncbi:MAG: DUF3109 family protein [Bacteroidales bacterium]|jgi:hypothetical protein|nr:DUF3109 family protein [Bacteroidales bacterium]